MKLKLGDNVTHKSRPDIGVGIITNIFENGKVTAEFPDCPKEPIYPDKPYAVFTSIPSDSLTKVDINMSTTKEEIYQYIIDLAVELIEKKQRMTLSDLANHLNDRFATDFTPGGIGIGQVVKAAWNRAEGNKNKVANAFVCANGLPCWQ